MHTSEPKIRIRSYFEDLQGTICDRLERIDGTARFTHDTWARPEGGGGRTRVIENGSIFEKGGVNTSAVWGILPNRLSEKMDVPSTDFFATGISLVLHPVSPMIPTVHMNLRYFELKTGDRWFGGGIDLTPNYLFAEDVSHFHRTLKHACDAHNRDYYPRFKQWCDEYFFIKHRNETRGTGGLFFDYLKGNIETIFLFVKEVGDSFLPAYVPIIERRISEPYGEPQRQWQLLRRGRYAEFNLVYDRGTRFGLETNGRVESILMSLPPFAAWAYDYRPEPGSKEEQMQHALKPRDWIRESGAES